MSTIKHEWTPAEESKLLKIKNNRSRKQKLEEFAAAHQMEYSAVYAKWNYLHHREGTFVRVGNGGPKGNAAPVFMAPTVVDSSVKIKPMVFGVVENFNAYNRIDAKEQVALETGLDKVIKDKVITPDNKRGINIPKKLAQRAKKYLTETYPEHAYCISTGKNVSPGFAVVSRTK